MPYQSYSQFSTKTTPQTEPTPGQEHKQVKNEAGGYTYKADRWARLDRFLLLGSEGGTYYVGEQQLTKDNASNVLACLASDPQRVVKAVVAVSESGRAPKNDQAIFVLALAASAKLPDGQPDVPTRHAALDNLHRVCRIPTHLYHFLEFCKGLRGWGPTLDHAVEHWLLSKPTEDLAYQTVKYFSRDGWSMRDVLRKAKPVSQDPARGALFRWAAKGLHGLKEGQMPPAIVGAFEMAKTATVSGLVGLIQQFNLPREALPTTALNHPEIWEALLAGMQGKQLTALVRNLGKMTAVGLVQPFSTAEATIVQRLTDADQLKAARVHPIALLLALKIYAQGHGDKGKLTWTPNAKVVDALNQGFYLAFNHLEPTGENLLVAVDCSGSMTNAQVNGFPSFSAAEGAAAMALCMARVEPHVHTICFDNQLRKVPVLTPTMRLDEVLKATSKLSGGGTDCAVPIRYALDQKLKVGTFLVITDAQSWAGPKHTSQALREFREQVNPKARMVEMAMTPTSSSLLDPDDTGCLGVAGFDASVPAIIQQFITQK
jgi:60 kDa SS-A/Ro ribonucleoprotein